MTKIVTQYLAENPLEESLVLDVEYQLNERKATFVYDYAAQVVSSYFESISVESKSSVKPERLRDFRRLKFYGVDNFNISKRGLNYVSICDLKKKIDTPGVVVQRAKITQDKINRSTKKLLINLSFGYDVSIEFADVKIDRRLCVAESAGPNKWKYFDCKTFEEVDFFQPFAGYKLR